MASADNINAGGAVVTVGGDTNPLQKAIEASKSQIQKFGESLQSTGKNLGIAAGIIGGIGAAITAPFAAGLAMLTDAAGGIAQAARRTGMSFEEVQDTAAGFRISVEDMPAIIAKMSSALVDARNPSSAMARNFAELGLSMDTLNSASQAERLDMIANALSNVSDEARRIDLAREVLGRQGMSINFNGGSAGARGRQERNRQLGGVISNEDIQAGLDYAKAQKELQIAIRGVSIVLGAILAPLLKEVASYFLESVMSVRAFLDENRTLAKVLATVGLSLAVIGSLLALDAARFILVGAAIAKGAIWIPLAIAWYKGLLVTLSGFSIAAKISVGWAMVGVAFAKVGAIIAAVVASAAFWPIVLVVGAIVAVVIAVYKAFGSWTPIFEIIWGGIKLLWQGILAVWGVVSGFIIGFISGALKIVGFVLKIAAAIWAVVSAAIVLPILAVVIGAAYVIGLLVVKVYRVFAAVLGYLWGIVVRVYDAVMDFVSGIIDSIDWISVLTGALIAAAPMLLYLFGPIIVAIGLVIGAFYLLKYVVGGLIDVWDEVSSAIRQGLSNVVEFVIDVAGLIYDAWEKMSQAIRGAIYAVFAYVDGAMDGMLSGAYDAFGSLQQIVYDAFGSILDVAIGVFNELRSIVSGGVDTVTAIVGDMGVVFAGIGDFISAGDWAGAFDIAMIGLRLAWERTKNWLIDSWYRVTFIFGSAWDSVVNSLYGALRPVALAIINIIAFMAREIQSGLNAMIDTMNDVGSIIPGYVNITRLNVVDTTANAATRMVNIATAPQERRVQGQADRGVQEGLEAELAARRRQAELVAWIAQGPPDDWEAAQRTGPAAALQFGAGAGSFSASAIGQIGVTNHAERIATAVEALVGPARRTADAMEADDGGVVAG